VVLNLQAGTVGNEKDIDPGHGRWGIDDDPRNSGVEVTQDARMSLRPTLSSTGGLAIVGRF